MYRRRRVTWTWTNWTFGAWRAKTDTTTAWGIDIGPLEIYWKKANRRG